MAIKNEKIQDSTEIEIANDKKSDKQINTKSTVTTDFINKNEMIIHFKIGDLIQTNVETERHGAFTRLEIPGSSYTEETGKPELPSITSLLAVPTTQIHLEILEVTTSECSVEKVIPVQKPLTDIPNADAEKIFTIDEAFYKSNTYYPQDYVKIDTGKIRDIPFAEVVFYPMQYNPGTEKATIYDNITIKIKWNETEPVSVEQDFRQSSFYNYYRNVFSGNWDQFIENTEFHEKQSSSYREATGCEYLIITHPDFINAANNLSEWKNKKGIPTRVVDTDETGTTNASIKQYIQNAYDNWHPIPSYLLLLGDVEYIPTFYETGGTWPSGTDLYYANVSGPDWQPDLFLGRISVDNNSQADLVVKKIIGYEMSPPVNNRFYQNMTFASYFQDDDRNGYEDPSRSYVKTSEDIRNYITTQGYDAERIYYAEYSDNPDSYLPPSHLGNGEPLSPELLIENYSWDGDYNDINNALNSGSFLVNHRDHGDYWGWSKPWYSVTPSFNHFTGLTNNELLPIIFSINCASGWFDSETDNNQYSWESFCEEMLRKNNGGAVGVIGATRDTTTSYNHILNKGLFDAIWPDFNPYIGGNIPLYKMGEVLNYGKNYIGVKELFIKYHLFGDPTMEIWTDLPKTMEVTHPSTLYTKQPLPLPFPVHVEEAEGGSVDEACVCLWKGNEVYMTGYTNSSGDITFYPLPSTIGTMYVTVTKHNYIPNQSEAEVEPPMVINNRTGEEFLSVQQAIDDSDTIDGDTLFAPSGIYYENIIINKNISLIGTNRDITIIEDTGYASSVIHIRNTNSVNITGFTIKNGTYGVYIESSSNTTIDHCIISDNIAFSMHEAYPKIPDTNDQYADNTNDDFPPGPPPYKIPKDDNPTPVEPYDPVYGCGIKLDNSDDNVVTNNTIIDNYKGIIITSESTGNLIYHNNFNNPENAYDNGINTWDNGYPSGGNCWSNFHNEIHGAYDYYHGENQDISGSDGIVDQGIPDGGLNPYNISGGDNKDRYPLAGHLYADANGPYARMVKKPVQFTGSADGSFPPYNWHWDFGDGNTSNEQNPLHTYDTIGNRTAVLTITDSTGISDIDTALVTVMDKPAYVWVDNDFTSYTDGWGYDHFDTIQDGIDTVIEGGTVYVQNGTYYEGIVVNKTIDLTGEDRNETIIDGYGGDYAVFVSESWVNITGFTIQRGSYGIYLTDASNNSIAENTITNNLYGIYLVDSSDNNIIMENILKDNNYNGIDLDEQSYNNTVSRNNISNSDNGIYFYDASYNIISGNIIKNNDYSGIYLEEHSPENTIFDNEISYNGEQGIFIWDASNNNIIYNNTITYNPEGIYICESSYNIISGNIIRHSSYEGIYIEEQSYNNTISENNITNNAYGILLISSSDNSIYYNNFNNSQNAYDDGNNFWDDGSTGNYWSDYTGSDNFHGPNQDIPGADGIGDASYNISGRTPPNQDRYPLIHPYGWTDTEPPTTTHTFGYPINGVNITLTAEDCGSGVNYTMIFIVKLKGDFVVDNGDTGVRGGNPIPQPPIEIIGGSGDIIDDDGSDLSAALPVYGFDVVQPPTTSTAIKEVPTIEEPSDNVKVITITAKPEKLAPLGWPADWDEIILSWTNYTGPVNVSGAGYYLLRYYSVDYEGNIEPRQSIHFEVTGDAGQGS